MFKIGEHILQVGCDESPKRGSYFCENHSSNLKPPDSYDFDDKYSFLVSSLKI
jgi:hypothetical protein